MSEPVTQLPADARFQAACYAMQGILANSGSDPYASADNVRETIKVAIGCADALIAELEKKGTP